MLAVSPVEIPSSFVEAPTSGHHTDASPNFRSKRSVGRNTSKDSPASLQLHLVNDCQIQRLGALNLEPPPVEDTQQRISTSVFHDAFCCHPRPGTSKSPNKDHRLNPASVGQLCIIDDVPMMIARFASKSLMQQVVDA